MNCHGDNKGKQGSHNHSSLKHMLHMIICCGLPIVIVAFLPLISRLNPSAGIWIGKIVPFLCLIMMIGMLPMMFRKNEKSSCCDSKHNETNGKDVPKLNKPVE
ncbi:hypothetical protein [Clostridium sp. Marseille-Q2269]|uniref:hypothetical protein n=1 Tax=Clostridium sp. Marseille-Q2269 TaxID=2942205 RepID=UPI0020742A9E|nr:hypothetical protein [Clostridium sp. Marseille-Q2269]